MSSEPAQCRPRPAESLDLCVLGSGSGGNSTVLRLSDRVILIDVGFGPITTRRRLRQAGIELEEVSAVCLTHLDQDHFRPSWLRTLCALRIRIFVGQWHRRVLQRRAGCLFDQGLVECFDRSFEAVPGLMARPLRLQHDRQGTIGFRFDSSFGSIGYATDLGHAPRQLIEHLAGVDLLCLECNYDEHMAIHSKRPSFVNRRNMSDSGHLSNEQSFDAVQRIRRASNGSNLRDILLMHRSSECNHPQKIRRIFERDPLLIPMVTLTEQQRRTRWFVVKPRPVPAMLASVEVVGQ